MNDRGEERGLLGEYGVLIVPPSDDSGEWFVTLGVWDDEREAYVTGTDGPLFASREEATEEAARLVDWLAEHRGEDDLFHVWERLQQLRSVREGVVKEDYAKRFPWEL